VKSKTVFICQNCGVESPKWIGKCPSCHEWNTYVEEKIQKDNFRQRAKTTITPQAQRLSEISISEGKRITTYSKEINRILGGGIVPGSVSLIGGEPGIGKSTLALQLSLNFKNKKTLYVSGEESNQQIKLRSERLGLKNENCFLLNETSLENIYIQIEKTNPDLLVIDSIQTLNTDYIESSPGSVSQVRECTANLLRYAKETSIPVILIGHINKEGNLAGPKVLEHIVDTVLQFEGDRNHMYRILRVIKNRYGATSEMAIFEMRNSGLIEVQNPSELLISQTDEQLSGVSICVTIDGIRPFLIESQALVSSAVYGTPQRSSTGFDLRRLSMLLAVLEKRAGFRLAAKDVFLNIAGGIKVTDPGIDLGIISAILSSNLDTPIEKGVCFAGEVGLSGEIRAVNRIETRIQEAEKLGFEKIFIATHNQKGIDLSKFNIQFRFVNRIEKLVRELFG
jgi:DNA repair protein RadA/Sms